MTVGASQYHFLLRKETQEEVNLKKNLTEAKNSLDINPESLNLREDLDREKKLHMKNTLHKKLKNIS